jgi:hypothetical protein
MISENVLVKCPTAVDYAAEVDERDSMPFHGKS